VNGCLYFFVVCKNYTCVRTIQTIHTFSFPEGMFRDRENTGFCCTDREFNEAAIFLVDALAACTRKNASVSIEMQELDTCSSDSGIAESILSTTVDEWKLAKFETTSYKRKSVDNKENQYLDDNIFLFHPLIFTRLCPNKRVKARQNGVSWADVDSSPESSCLYVDWAILTDSVESILAPTYDENQFTLLQWNLSCVYSETWQIPVLYFDVRNVSTGQPCSREEVLSYLVLDFDGLPVQSDETNQIESSWNFLSFDEHPISRLPSFFLHPCRTSERMGLIESTLMQHSTCGVETRAVLLHSWLSLMLAPLRMKLSLESFIFLQRKTYLSDIDNSISP
jgi:Autophagocytosis associated protein, active-site domain